MAQQLVKRKTGSQIIIVSHKVNKANKNKWNQSKKIKMEIIQLTVISDKIIIEKETNILTLIVIQTSEGGHIHFNNVEI